MGARNARARAKGDTAVNLAISPILLHVDLVAMPALHVPVLALLVVLDGI
jgi:hypothetical protein